MKIPIWQVDAFTGRMFGGNPAAVCILEKWLPDDLMQKIAAENNLAETAFVCRETMGGYWHIRWFTPTVEVDLCGHATLAAAFVLFTEKRADGSELLFQSRSGELLVLQTGNQWVLDFPARPPQRVDAADYAGLEQALGIAPGEVWKARDLLVVLENEEQVRSLRPDMVLLAGLDVFAVCVTAPGKEVDFVSRFFAPQQGIPEDPVTGSAHCSLIPYWAHRLGRKELRATQVSARGGELFCRLMGDRVEMGGQAVLYLKGEIWVQ